MLQVYHLAARARVQPSYTAPNDYILDNVIGTQKLLEACRLAGIKKIVFASSSTVSYLNNTNGNSPYAVSKSMCEDLCKMYKDHYGINTVSLRYFSVYGEKMDLSLKNSTVLGRILRCMVKVDEPFQLYGTGNNSRDFTYVGDIVNGTISAMENIENLKYSYYEMGCTLPISIKTILASVPYLVVEKVPKVAEIPITMSTCASANRDFGFVYRTHVKDWFKEQVNNLDYWKQRLELYEN
jgi:nucleoside-diphosphate-sugar epimerase